VVRPVIQIFSPNETYSFPIHVRYLTYSTHQYGVHFITNLRSDIWPLYDKLTNGRPGYHTLVPKTQLGLLIKGLPGIKRCKLTYIYVNQILDYHNTEE